MKNKVEAGEFWIYTLFGILIILSWIWNGIDFSNTDDLIYFIFPFIFWLFFVLKRIFRKKK